LKLIGIAHRVMAGLDPAIQAATPFAKAAARGRPSILRRHGLDGRVKPGHDGDQEKTHVSSVFIAFPTLAAAEGAARVFGRLTP
jgi:hypothetical protein